MILIHKSLSLSLILFLFEKKKRSNRVAIRILFNECKFPIYNAFFVIEKQTRAGNNLSCIKPKLPSKRTSKVRHQKDDRIERLSNQPAKWFVMLFVLQVSLELFYLFIPSFPQQHEFSGTCYNLTSSLQFQASTFD